MIKTIHCIDCKVELGEVDTKLIKVSFVPLCVNCKGKWQTAVRAYDKPKPDLDMPDFLKNLF